MILGLLFICLAAVLSFTRKTAVFATLVSIASIFLCKDYISVLSGHYNTAYILTLPGLLGNAELSLNPLSALFGLIFAIGIPLGAWYGHSYLAHYPDKGLRAHLFFFGLMSGSLHLLIWAQHSVLFFAAWEIMSLSSFFALMYDKEKPETVRSGFYYFIMMHVGALFLLAGFSLCYLYSGSFNFADYKGMPLLPAILLIVGFSFKAGFFPFYSWLPKAHPAAPSHISGLMSGLIIKTGIFGILVVLNLCVMSPWLVLGLGVISMLTAFLGVIHALVETNIKRICAYSSIENIGIIGLGISVALMGKIYGYPLMAALGICGALLHVVNHSLFKALLFYIAGNVYCQTHCLELDQLGGLQKRMKYSSVLGLGGVMAISALPGFNGFVSELLIYLGLSRGFQLGNIAVNIGSIIAVGVFAFIGALALFAFLRLYSFIFLGAARSPQAESAVEVPTMMLIVPSILAILCLGLGLFAVLGIYLVNPVVVYLGYSSVLSSSLWQVLKVLSIVMPVFFVIFVALYVGRSWFLRKKSEPTWGCGYENPSPRMQYSGNSFINPIAYFLKPFMQRKTQLHPVTEIFPQQLESHTEIRDFVDNGGIRPLVKIISAFLDFFARIDSDKTQVYITYLLIFLIALLCFVVLGVR